MRMRDSQSFAVDLLFLDRLAVVEALYQTRGFLRVTTDTDVDAPGPLGNERHKVEEGRLDVRATCK